MATTAFGKHCVLGAQFHARHVAVFMGAVSGHAHVASDDAFNNAIFKDVFGCREARVDLDTQIFSLLTQPARYVTQRYDVVAIVVHWLRDSKVRGFDRFFIAGQEIHLITFNRGVQRSAHFFPVREQLSQCTVFNNSAGEDMCADFGAFFYQTD